jgi:hypothetical protein
MEELILSYLGLNTEKEFSKILEDPDKGWSHLNSSRILIIMLLLVVVVTKDVPTYASL